MPLYHATFRTFRGLSDYSSKMKNKKFYAYRDDVMRPHYHGQHAPDFATATMLTPRSDGRRYGALSRLYIIINNIISFRA